MKKLTIASAVFGVVAFSAGAAFAGDDWEAKLEEKFAAIDTNSDGSVSEAEYLAYKNAKVSEHFAKISGGDGSLTLAEAKAAHKAEYAKTKARHKKKKDSN